VSPAVVPERIASPEAEFGPFFIYPAEEIRQKDGQPVKPTRPRISAPTDFAITLVACADRVAGRCPLRDHKLDQEEESVMEDDKERERWSEESE
jgi:hypothetical protein